jgi:hypothetical protein
VCQPCILVLPALSVAEWEAAAAKVPNSTRVVIIRTGIVLARDGGVLARMLPMFELFAGEWGEADGNCPSLSVLTAATIILLPWAGHGAFA